MSSKVTITLFKNGESHATEISVSTNAETVDWNLIREIMSTMIADVSFDSEVSFDPGISIFLFTVKEI